MALQELLDQLDGQDLSAEQYRKLHEIRQLAEKRGLILDPTAQPNVRKEKIQQGRRPEKTFADSATEFLSRDVPEIGAATAGGMAGAQQAARLPLPGMLKPIGIVAGGVAGATAGLTALRSGRKSLEQGRPVSLDELLAEGQRSGAEAAVGESLGVGARLLGKGYQSGRRAFLSGRTGTPEELQVFNQAKDMGVHLRPADVTLSPTALRTEQYARETQAGSDLFRKRDILNQDNFKQAFDRELSDTVASKVTPQERGALVKDLIEGRAIPEFQELARRGYDHLRQITGGEKVVLPTQSLALAQDLAGSISAKANRKNYAIAEEILDALGQRGATTGLVIKRVETEGRPALMIPNPTFTPGEPFSVRPAIPSQLHKLEVRQNMEQGNVSEGQVLAKPLDFMEAHAIRSRLGELSATGETLPGPAQEVATQLWKALGHEMEQGALKYRDKTGIPVDKLWRQADDLVKKEGHELFDANVISKLLKANPEDVVKETFKPNGLTEVQLVVKALGRIKDEPGLEQWRRGVLEHLWEGGIVKTGVKRGEFSGSVLADEAMKYGEPTLKEALGPIYPRFKTFLNVASHMDPKGAGGFGMSLKEKGLLISAPLAGLGGSLLSGSPWPFVGAAGAMGTWLIGTHHLAKIMNDPRQASKLLNVMQSKPGSEVWTRALGQLGGIEAGEKAFPRPIQSGQLQQAPVQGQP